MTMHELVRLKQVLVRFSPIGHHERKKCQACRRRLGAAMARVVVANARPWVMGKRQIGEDGLTRTERRRQLAAHGWQLVGRASSRDAWQFRQRDGRQLVVPCRTEVDARWALPRHLQGETSVPHAL
jgi:hypothetical protein